MNFKEYNINEAPEPDHIKRSIFFNEMKSIFQPLRLLTNYRKLTKAKIGNGQRVILFPGWKATATSMYPMKKFLSKIGYEVEYWGLGMNNGNIEKDRDRIVERLSNEANSEPVTLIGWSLGGLVAREIAREIPHKIASVVTYGTPVIDGPKYTIGAKFWSQEETKRIIELSRELNATKPIQVPMSIIFTKEDSIVNWAACLDNASENVTHYEVNSTHLSLGIDPEVWSIVAGHLQKYAA